MGVFSNFVIDGKKLNSDNIKEVNNEYIGFLDIKPMKIGKNKMYVEIMVPHSVDGYITISKNIYFSVIEK